MNILGVAAIAILFLAVTNDQVAQAASALLLAGVVPFFDVQLPWYAIVIGAPLMLLLLAKSLQEMLRFGFKKLAKTETKTKKPLKATTKTSTKKNTITKKKAKQAKKTENAALPLRPTRRFTHLEA